LSIEILSDTEYKPVMKKMKGVCCVACEIYSHLFIILVGAVVKQELEEPASDLRASSIVNAASQESQSTKRVSLV
jgi:hypothetical protein